MSPGVLPSLPLNFMGVGLFEQSCQLRADFGEMIEQLRICKIVRSRDVRVLIDCCRPGLENFLAPCEYKIAKFSDCRDRRPALTVRSDKIYLLLDTSGTTCSRP